jgi:hypothetical protein
MELPAADYLRAQLDRPHPPQGFVGTFPASELEALQAVAEKCGYLFEAREMSDGMNISVHCDRKPT